MYSAVMVIKVSCQNHFSKFFHVYILYKFLYKYIYEAALGLFFQVCTTCTVLEKLIKLNMNYIIIIYNYVADLETKEKVNNKNYKTVLAASRNFVVSHIKGLYR